MAEQRVGDAASRHRHPFRCTRLLHLVEGFSRRRRRAGESNLSLTCDSSHNRRCALVMACWEQGLNSGIPAAVFGAFWVIVLACTSVSLVPRCGPRWEWGGGSGPPPIIGPMVPPRASSQSLPLPLPPRVSQSPPCSTSKLWEDHDTFPRLVRAHQEGREQHCFSPTSWPRQASRRMVSRSSSVRHLDDQCNVRATPPPPP